MRKFVSLRTFLYLENVCVMFILKHMSKKFKIQLQTVPCLNDVEVLLCSKLTRDMPGTP